MDRQTHTWYSFWLISPHISSLNLSFVHWLSPAACDTWMTQGHPIVHQLWNVLKDIFIFVLSCVWHSKWIGAKTQKAKNICLTETFLTTYEVIPYMWYRRGRSIQTEVMRSVFWLNAIIPTPKMRSCGGIRFVMISLCIYNAHRTVVLSGPIGAAVVMNHSRNVVCLM